MTREILITLFFITFGVAAGSCELISRPVTAVTKPERKAPYAGCQLKPQGLPAIATEAQVKARHDKLDGLYDDCAARARANAEAVK